MLLSTPTLLSTTIPLLSNASTLLPTSPAYTLLSTPTSIPPSSNASTPPPTSPLYTHTTVVKRLHSTPYVSCLHAPLYTYTNINTTIGLLPTCSSLRVHQHQYHHHHATLHHFLLIHCELHHFSLYTKDKYMHLFMYILFNIPLHVSY